MTPYHPIETVFAGWSIIGDFQLSHEEELGVDCLVEQITLTAGWREQEGTVQVQIAPNSKLWEEILGDFFDSPLYSDLASAAKEALDAG